MKNMKRENLLEKLRKEGRFVENPCNGKGICGKCKVKILSGDAGKVTETERRFLSEEELAQGIRLSCMVYPEEELEVETLQKEKKAEVLSEGYVPEFEKHTEIKKQLIHIRKPNLKDQTSMEDQLLIQLGNVEIPFSLLQHLELTEGTYTAVIWSEKSLMALEPGDQTDYLYGAAIDIGTTTVVTSLIDMMTGKEMGTASRINAQKEFGLDVLTRISYETEHPEDGKEHLQKVITDSINEMLDEVCRKTEVPGKGRIEKHDIYEITVAANCTMMHMLLGVSARSIGRAPYAPAFVKSKNLRAAEIGIQAGEGARLYCLPSVSAYIGADIVAGAYVCELRKQQKNVLFIDIGTNGEIVFSDHGRLLSCSCAAGPALEAMPKLVPNMDKEISQNLKMILKKRGIDIHTSAAVQGVTTEDGTCTCHYIEKDQEQEVTADYVLCAVGRGPNTDGLFGENVKPDMERGRVLVNENFESSIPGVYAIGDLIFGAQLAHAASAQGMVVAEKLAGKEPSIDLSIVPGCVYTDPEIASAGMTEDQAKEKGIAVKCGKFIMSANGKSIITQEERGFIKVVAEEATGKILGAQMMCARATDMIGEFVTAITNGLTVKQMLKGMRSHPTYNEGIGEALEELEGGAVHVVPRKKK